jgi:hypothetical protein
LILAPTRELALQVSSHLNSIMTSVEYEDKNTNVDEAGKKRPPHVSVAAIVGGMSAQKQRRLLDRGIDVLVATPGRLWDILQDVSWKAIVFMVCELIERWARTANLCRRFGESDFWFLMRPIGWFRRDISPNLRISCD